MKQRLVLFAVNVDAFVASFFSDRSLALMWLLTMDILLFWPLELILGSKSTWKHESSSVFEENVRYLCLHAVCLSLTSRALKEAVNIRLQAAVHQKENII